MQCRALRWLVLGFTTLWFGVLVPVHNRGQIGLPGSECAARHDVASACHDATPSCHNTSGNSAGREHHESAPRPARACAVCYFIAGLDAPPPVTVIVTRLGFAGSTEVAAPQQPASVRITFPYHSRAPPAA